MKCTCNNEQWRKINSKAQLISQNKPEVKEKMREIIKNKIKTNEGFRNKITRYSNGHLCGFYKGIKFLSSYELSVLYFYGDKIKNCNIVIPYIWKGKECLYLPDFELTINDKKYIIEVKGTYKSRDKVKVDTTKQLIKNNQLNFDDILVLDKSYILNTSNIKLFTTPESLLIFSPKDLQILSYPKKWIVPKEQHQEYQYIKDN